MKSERFVLNMYDLYSGALMYVITTLVMSMGSLVFVEGFSVFTADWLAILKNSVDVSVIATFSYLMKNLVTDKNGVL